MNGGLACFQHDLFHHSIIDVHADEQLLQIIRSSNGHGRILLRPGYVIHSMDSGMAVRLLYTWKRHTPPSSHCIVTVSIIAY